MPRVWSPSEFAIKKLWTKIRLMKRGKCWKCLKQLQKINFSNFVQNFCLQLEFWRQCFNSCRKTFSSLWNELNNGLITKNENKLPELLLVCKILHILPSNFKSFKSSWMLLAKDEGKENKRKYYGCILFYFLYYFIFSCVATVLYVYVFGFGFGILKIKVLLAVDNKIH